MKKKKLLWFIPIIILIIVIKCCYNDYVITYCDEFNCKKIELNTTFYNIKRKYKDSLFLKIDKIVAKKKVDNKELTNIIDDSLENQFAYGININNKVSILSEELNSKHLIDYDNKKLDKDNIYYYLYYEPVKLKNIDYDNIYLIKTKSYSRVKNSKVNALKLENGFHVKKYIDNDVELIINNSANRLNSMLLDDGSFIYGYYINEGKTIDSYNILRHAGSIYSLIKYYEYSNNDNIKDSIVKGIDYIINNCLIKNKKGYFVLEKKNKELKLGGSALTLLALSEYQIAFNDDKYYDIAAKIADGIIYFSNDDGSYNHVLDLNLNIIDKYRTVYYDGEATFSLLKFYEISKDSKYYKLIQKTIDLFIDNNYLNYHDHWISYSMNSFLKYNQEEKYIQFALDNYSKNEFDSIVKFSPTRLELLSITLDTYNYLNNQNIYSDSLEEFDISKLKYSINKAKEVLLNYYIDEEMAIYFDNKDIILYGFTSITDDFRMRIDDIQHSILGLMIYDEIINHIV